MSIGWLLVFIHRGEVDFERGGAFLGEDGPDVAVEGGVVGVAAVGVFAGPGADFDGETFRGGIGLGGLAVTDQEHALGTVGAFVVEDDACDDAVADFEAGDGGVADVEGEELAGGVELVLLDALGAGNVMGSVTGYGDDA